jgi:solute carrier family 35, member F5
MTLGGEDGSGIYETIEEAPGSSQFREWTTRDHYLAALRIAPVWFISNWSYNASLRYTTITSSTVLSSTGSLFTFLFAVLLKDESFTAQKLVGVLLGMAGSIVTGVHDLREEENSAADEESYLPADYKILGDSLGLFSAVGYGTYTVMVRVLLPRQEELFSMQVFLGFVGLFNCVALSPIMLWQAYSSPDLTFIVLAFVCLKGLLDNVLSDYLWARAVLLTSATVATVGVGLTIPMAFFSDWLLGNADVLDISSLVGALAVLFGFVLVNLGTTYEEAVLEHSESGPEDGGHSWDFVDSEQNEVSLPNIRNHAHEQSPGRAELEEELESDGFGRRRINQESNSYS